MESNYYLNRETDIAKPSFQQIYIKSDSIQGGLQTSRLFLSVHNSVAREVTIVKFHESKHSILIYLSFRAINWNVFGIQ